MKALLMNYKLWLGVSVLLIVVSPLLFFYGGNNDPVAEPDLSRVYESFDHKLAKEKEAYEDLEVKYHKLLEDNEVYEDELHALETENDKLELRLEEVILAEENAQLLVNEDSYWAMSEKFSGSFEWIIDDLLQHSEIIQRQAVLGGTMHFTKGYLLTDRLALGVYDDGHIMGAGIYEFYLDQDNNLQWTVVLEHIDGED